jgi:hypothetical protein
MPVTSGCAGGLTLVLDSGEWGQPYDRRRENPYINVAEVPPRQREMIRKQPDPEPLVSFAEAVKTRKQPGGHPEAAHRCATLLHLANIAIRVGRKVHYDPEKEEIVGDEEANRLVNVPMRAPWHL